MTVTEAPRAATPSDPRSRLDCRYVDEVAAAGLPTGPGDAVWHLPDGPLTYIKGRLALDSVAFNVAPPV